jgi:hypothetical protein
MYDTRSELATNFILHSIVMDLLLAIKYSTDTNELGQTYVSWTFKKQPRFFDMVKYTGNGVAGREIAHDLGCDVGMIIVKDATQRTGNLGSIWHIGFNLWTVHLLKY